MPPCRPISARETIVDRRTDSISELILPIGQQSCTPSWTAWREFTMADPTRLGFHLCPPSDTRLTAGGMMALKWHERPEPHRPRIPRRPQRRLCTGQSASCSTTSEIADRKHKAAPLPIRQVGWHDGAEQAVRTLNSQDCHRPRLKKPALWLPRYQQQASAHRIVQLHRGA